MNPAHVEAVRSIKNAVVNKTFFEFTKLTCAYPSNSGDGIPARITFLFDPKTFTLVLLMRFEMPRLIETFLKALRALRNAELPDTRPTEWFSGAERLANQSFDRQIFLHNRTLRAHYAARICPSTRHSTSQNHF